MKRIRITKTGKLLARQAGLNHFNAKESRSKQTNAKRLVNFKMKRKLLSNLIPRQTGAINF